jgi:hypothetical protein
MEKQENFTKRCKYLRSCMKRNNINFRMKEDYEFKTTHTLGGRNFFATLNECIE